MTARTGTLAHRVLQPDGWPAPRGYSNGVSATGRMVFTGGLVGWDEKERFADGLAGQIRQTLANTLAVLAAGGAGPEHIVRMTWYVCSIEEYLANRKEIGVIWRELVGAIYPPMAVVEVSRLVERRALVEIETTAVVPGSEDRR